MAPARRKYPINGKDDDRLYDKEAKRWKPGPRAQMHCMTKCQLRCRARHPVKTRDTGNRNSQRVTRGQKATRYGWDQETGYKVMYDHTATKGEQFYIKVDGGKHEEIIPPSKMSGRVIANDEWKSFSPSKRKQLSESFTSKRRSYLRQYRKGNKMDFRLAGNHDKRRNSTKRVLKRFAKTPDMVDMLSTEELLNKTEAERSVRRATSAVIKAYNAQIRIHLDAAKEAKEAGYPNYNTKPSLSDVATGAKIILNSDPGTKRLVFMITLPTVKSVLVAKKAKFEDYKVRNRRGKKKVRVLRRGEDVSKDHSKNAEKGRAARKKAQSKARARRGPRRAAVKKDALGNKGYSPGDSKREKKTRNSARFAMQKYLREATSTSNEDSVDEVPLKSIRRYLNKGKLAYLTHITDVQVLELYFNQTPATRKKYPLKNDATAKKAVAEFEKITGVSVTLPAPLNSSPKLGPKGAQGKGRGKGSAAAATGKGRGKGSSVATRAKSDAEITAVALKRMKEKGVSAKSAEGARILAQTQKDLGGGNDESSSEDESSSSSSSEDESPPDPVVRRGKGGKGMGAGMDRERDSVDRDDPRDSGSSSSEEESSGTDDEDVFATAAAARRNAKKKK